MASYFFFFVRITIAPMPTAATTTIATINTTVEVFIPAGSGSPEPFGLVSTAIVAVWVSPQTEQVRF